MFRKVFQQDLQDKLLQILKLDASAVATAQELISRHGMTPGIGLRSLDAIQLASACALKEHGFCRFVNSDKRLGVAAKKEGFAIIDPEIEDLDE